MILCRSSYMRGPEISNPSLSPSLSLERFEYKIDLPPESILDSKCSCKSRPPDPLTPRPPAPYPQTT